MSFVRKSQAIVTHLTNQCVAPSSDEKRFSSSEAAINEILVIFKGKAILKNKYLKQIQEPFQDAFTIWCHNADSTDINNRYHNLITNVKNRIGKLPSAKTTNSPLNNIKIELHKVVAVHNKIVDEIKDWTPASCK